MMAQMMQFIHLLPAVPFSYETITFLGDCLFFCENIREKERTT